MMSTQATSTTTVTAWDEKTWDGKGWNEVQGAKLTHAKVVQSFEGDIQGEATTQMLMSYQTDNSVTFVGLQQIVGTLGGRSGSFVIQINGSFDGTTARNEHSVVPGSGTGELTGLRGTGSAVTLDEKRSSFALDYEL